ncbi:MAG: hypothetical protein NPIRA02_20970 [Nitrospirales bacterium]|nr:MAG: hypothetical protein NPIRA02_20970 [Nitrospirales bacterium]
MKMNWKLSVCMTTVMVSSVFSWGVFSTAIAADSLDTIKEQFGPVLKLEGKARKEINAIANILGPDSKMKPIDATDASGEMCMLETASKHNMIHFSETPEQTHEDVVYFINPATFIANGLDVTKLPRHPSELGKMKPLQWYYYDGTYVEPHQGGQLNKEFVIMSVDVK